MQKTFNAKNTFHSYHSPPPSHHIANNKPKRNLNSQRPQTQPVQEIVPQQTAHKLMRKRNFQYYFYDKYNSAKQLNQLRNSPAAKNLLQLQRKKSARLDNQLQQKSRETIQGQNQQSHNVPFYKRYKLQPIFNDPQLADYGQFYSRKNLKRQTSPPHNFEKLKQNKLNINKYRLTKGMISPQKKHHHQNPHYPKSIDVQPKYNRSLSPFQFKNTIEGRLATRQDKNLRMDLDKTHKINNINKVWYKDTPDIDKQNQEFLQMRKSIEFQQKVKKCHSFDSYKGHRLFESRLKKVKTPADDKFYDPEGEAKSMSIYQKWKTQNHIDMSKCQNRAKLPQKLGTHLQYQIPGPDMNKSPSKKYQMGISKSERNLVFTRQIINPKRGCYR